jgi:hypothetical protein
LITERMKNLLIYRRSSANRLDPGFGVRTPVGFPDCHSRRKPYSATSRERDRTVRCSKNAGTSPEKGGESSGGQM